MSNIKIITKEEFLKVIKLQPSGFCVTINCKYIQTWEQFAEALGNAFQFPMRNEGFDGTYDWMTDFSWSSIINQKLITIYLTESKEMFKNNQSLKTRVISFLENIIDHWNDKSNLGYINGKPGETKVIEVYLVV